MQERRFERIRLESPAMISIGEQIFGAVTKDISLNGVFIHTGQSLELGKKAMISLQLPSASRSSGVTVDGIVVRNADDGVAFRFRSLDHDTFSYLKSVINRKTATMLRGFYNA